MLALLSYLFLVWPFPAKNDLCDKWLTSNDYAATLEYDLPTLKLYFLNDFKIIVGGRIKQNQTILVQIHFKDNCSVMVLLKIIWTTEILRSFQYWMWHQRYSCESSDTEEKKWLNKVVIFVFFVHKKYYCSFITFRLNHWFEQCPYHVGVDRYVFFRADADTDYYRSSRPITDILNRYMCLV